MRRARPGGAPPGCRCPGVRLGAGVGGFCGRWWWGVRSLVQDGDQSAERLGLTAGIYADTEQYLTGVAKNVTVAVAGDPHLSDGQAGQASWAQDAAGATGAATPGSGTSWAQTGQQARQQWEQVRRDELKGPEAIRRWLGGATGGEG